MRIKTDFVTNSSSATILLYVESTEENLEVFKEQFNRYIEDYKERYNEEIVHFWDPRSITQLTPHTFEISHYTSMYNDQEDIPHYMRVLLLASLIDVEKGNLIKYGFKGVNIKVESDY
jgi:hypothetical protein